MHLADDSHFLVRATCDLRRVREGDRLRHGFFGRAVTRDAPRVQHLHVPPRALLQLARTYSPTMALCASRAATLLRVRCQAAPLLRGADLRVYSTATSRSDLLKSIKTHCTNWIEQKRPVAMERFNDLSKRWNVMSGYENILHHKEQVELECMYPVLPSRAPQGAAGAKERGQVGLRQRRCGAVRGAAQDQRSPHAQGIVERFRSD